MTNKRIISFLVLMVPVTVGAVCMPLAILGLPHNVIYPFLLVGGLFGLVVLAYKQED